MILSMGVKNLSRIEISKIILGIKYVFNLTDLFYVMKDYGCTNHALLMNILDDMYDNGVIEYVELDDGRWGYKVAVAGSFPPF